MKKIILLALCCTLFGSCSKKEMDEDVKKDVQSARVVDRASIMLAVPIVVGVTNHTKEEKLTILKEYEQVVAEITKLKVEQRKVVATILDKLTVENYSPDKMKQLTDRHTVLESEISTIKTMYLKKFIKSVQGKVTQESVSKAVNEFNSYFDEMEEVPLPESN